MTKTIIASLLVALTSFSTCNRTEPTNRGSDSQTGPTSEARAVSDVLILFSGLMVFHEEEEDKPGYEVGILPAEHHIFEVEVDSIDITHRLPKGRHLIFEITNAQQTPDVPPLGKGPIAKRRPDDEAHKTDFGWIIDLENEFHPDLNLNLIPGVLKPIFHLPIGELSTRFKSYDLIRGQGSSNDEKFGFVPETITLALKLHPNQDLLLKNELGEVVKVISQPLPFHIVAIKNISHPQSELSDFHFYYTLFGKDVPQEKQYHFKPNEIDPFPALNPFPGSERTCCMMACTAVLLGKRTKALE